jgi:hypothetical protein
MSWLVLAFIVTVAVLAPIFGADTRDGRDWKPTTTPAPGDPPRNPRSHTRPSRIRHRHTTRTPALIAHRVRTGT